jgi:hypothetical protein
MSESFDRKSSLGVIPRSHAERLRFLPEADRTVVAEIQAGVLFVMAFWSGPARQAFKLLNEALAEHDPDETLQLVVVDTDGCPDLYETEDFAGQFPSRTFTGSGETAWILRGKVIATSAYAVRGDLEKHTKHLLEGVAFFSKNTPS